MRKIGKREGKNDGGRRKRLMTWTGWKRKKNSEEKRRTKKRQIEVGAFKQGENKKRKQNRERASKRTHTKIKTEEDSKSRKE